MKRVALFLLTNLAIIVVLGITASILMAIFAPQGLQTAGGGMNLPAILILAAVFGMGGSFISLAMSKWVAKRMTGAQVIEQPRGEAELWLVSTVQRLAREAGIGMPEVAVFQSASPNAFATGMSKNKALVAVSTGLLQTMNRDEVEAVLAHEVTHIANGDMVTLALIQGVVNTFVIFLARVVGHFVDRVLLKNEEGYGIGYFISVIVAEIVFAVLASMIVFWFSRQREFRADTGGARLAGRDKMVSALRRLAHSHGQQLPDQIAAFGIRNGGVRGGIKRLFMTHPPLEERIAALQQMR